MPKSSVAKGNSYEIECKKFLESMGWQVFRQHRKPLFMKGRMITIGADIFGCDLVAKKRGQKTIWIQVSTQSNQTLKERQIMSGNVLNPEWEDYELWLRQPKERLYKVYRLRWDDYKKLYTFDYIISHRVNSALKLDKKEKT